MAMPVRVRQFLFVLGVSAWLVACSAPSNGGTGGGATLACEREGYPCSLADVPESVRDASWSALESAYDALANGTIDDAATDLEARGDLAELARDGRMLRFRLEGGAPTFLYDITGLHPADAVGATSARSALSEPLLPSAVVGRDRNGDGHVDNRDPKRALFMSPYKWDFAPLDEGDLLATNLASGPPYENNVDYVENPTEGSRNITLEDWRSWYEYDFVYVSSHGARMAAGGTTQVVISSGVRADRTEPLPSTGAWRLGMVDRAAAQSSRIIEYGLGPDFFRWTYGEGLDDTMVVFSACQTGAEGASQLADAIGGDNFVMMGWSEIVYSSDAFRTASAFLEYLLKGLRADEAHARLVSDGLTVGDPVPLSDGSPGRPPVFTRYAPAGGDQRLIEVPTLLDEFGEALRDETDLRDALDGSAGDGAPDVLTITTRLMGVEQGTEDGYRIGFELDDVATPDRYGIGAATRLDDATVELELDVALGRDAPTEPVDLTAIVELPEGGESRYVAEVTLGRACSWTMTFSSPEHGGTFERDFGVVVLGQPTNITLQSDALVPTRPAVNIQVAELPTGVPATLALGLSGSQLPGQDGTLVVNVEGADYFSGDGSSCCTVTNPVDTFPEPVVFELTANDPERIEGTLTGEVWAYADGGGTPLRKAGVDVDFAVTNDDACRVYDPTNPF